MARWIKAVAVDGFAHTAKFVHRRREYALYKLDDGVYCTDNSCSHEYSPLSEGMVTNGEVYCPKHGSRFDIRTGEAKDLPATQAIRTYETRIEDGWVYVLV